MNAATLRPLLAAVVAAALASGLSPGAVHGELALAGMLLDDNRIDEALDAGPPPPF